MKKVLVVCFTFPPYNGIGGRRWAKFCKYLVKNKVDLRVIAAKRTPGLNGNEWDKDIDEYKNAIEYISTPYPKILSEIPKTFFDKIRYKLALEYVKIRYAKGNYFDPSCGFGEKIKSNIEHWINEGYNNVIVSCGPFSMALPIIGLKKKYPSANFIADFRDPWANNKTSFGFLTISPKRREFEFDSEKKVIEEYDKIISVSEEMNQYFENLSGSGTDKFVALENGFDSENIGFTKTSGRQFSGKLKFIFTGTLYEKSRHIFNELMTILDDMKAHNPDVYKILEFDFYGKVPNWFTKEIINHTNTVFFHGERDYSELVPLISDSDLCMLFLTDDLTYSRSTKFYEYLALRRPIVVFSGGGKTGEYVEENGIGYSCVTGQMKEKLLKIYEDWKDKKIAFNEHIEIGKHDVKNLTMKLIDILDNSDN